MVAESLAVSETSFQYIVQAPSPEAPAEKRLGYFVKFLEFPDLAIASIMCGGRMQKIGL